MLPALFEGASLAEAPFRECRMKIKLVETIKEHKYGGRTRAVGEQYEAQMAHLPFLIKAKYVKIVEPKPAPMPPPALVPANSPEKPIRNYKRRDLQAEK